MVTIDRFTELLAQKLNPPRRDVFPELDYKPSEVQWRFHEASRDRTYAVLYGGARGGGKLIGLNELIPTPFGFTKLADIHGGDLILGRDGKSHVVLYESEVQFVEGWQFTFDDGSTIVTNDEHLWLTYDASERTQLLRRSPEYRERRRATRKTRGPGGKRSERFSEVCAERNRQRALAHQSEPVTGTVRTTAEIVATLADPGEKRQFAANHAVPVCEPVELPERDLPIDPYLLGAWLGDGSASSGVITSMDPEIPQAFVDAGFVNSSTQKREDNQASHYYFRGLRSTLRGIGVFGNKHIPHDYLWASREQRLALLQGLMDTDGCANKNGSVEFCNTNQSLTEGVAHLARSLGMKAAVREGRAKIGGKDYGPKWTVKFTPLIPVFRLERKLARQQTTGSQRLRFRYIVKAERVEALPMKCLRVSSPDHLFLATENFIPTHNTAAATCDAIDHAVNTPGIMILCARRTYGELEESFLRELAKRRFANETTGIGARWNGTERTLRFPNGSSIRYTYCENEQDMSRLRGGEYQAIYVDEASLMAPSILEQLSEQLRSGLRSVPVIGLRFMTNPGGASHAWLKNRFITPSQYGKLKITDELGRPMVFIPAKATDNPHIDKGYQAVLDAIPDPVRRAAMRDGDWDAMEGAFFTQWTRGRHCVPAFKVPKQWPRYCGIDYGFAAPFAAVFAAEDQDGRLWVYSELYMTQVQAEDQAKLILERERFDDVSEIVRVADPSMWGERGTPLTIADIYGINGCGLTKANNNRLNGWARVHQYLNDAPACEYHRDLGWETCPRLHIFDAQCPKLTEEIGSLPRHPNKPDDAATTNVNDHAVDALRYLCMAVGTQARPVLHDDLSPVAPGAPPPPQPAFNSAPDYGEQLPMIGGRFVIGGPWQGY